LISPEAPYNGARSLICWSEDWAECFAVFQKGREGTLLSVSGDKGFAPQLHRIAPGMMKEWLFNPVNVGIVTA